MLRAPLTINAMISKIEFDVLTALERGDTVLTDRVPDSLYEKGYVSEREITKAGLEALEPFKVRRAVFFAAGFGSRMVPATLTTPKPLIPVKGERLIDTLLSAVVSAGIEEIYIVRGYLAQKFDELLQKYPQIKFIENPKYNEANNISSAYLAGELLSGAYVLEADLVLYNQKLITKYQYRSNYLGVPCEKTGDWCFKYDGAGRITELLTSGEDCAHMYGISYWSEADGKRLCGHIKALFEREDGKQLYWDEVALKYFKNEYQVYVRECSFEDIIEIDTYAELCALDKSYKEV